MKQEVFEDTLHQLESLEQKFGIRFQSVAEDVKSKKQFYVFYPLLFFPLFPGVPAQSVRKITLAGNLYFRYLISLDACIDAEQEPKCLLTAHVLHEAALDILHELFEARSCFWKYFYTYGREFLTALARESECHRNPAAVPTVSDMQIIARGKSAYAKAATAALAALASREELLETLSASQDAFHIGLQLYDDVVDWNKDYTDGRYSYLLTTVLHMHGERDSSKRPAVDLMGRMVYFSKAAESHLEMSRDYLQRAFNLVKGLECPEWIRIIAYRIQVVEELRKDLQKIREREQERVTRSRSSARVPTPQSDTSLGDRMERVIRFLVANQESNGYFSDFFTSAGESTNWVTGYVGHALQATTSGMQAALGAKEALLRFRSPSGGWGYNQSIVVDCDSTSWALKFLLTAGVSPAELHKDFQVFLQHQKSNGGFCTYQGSKEIARIIKVPENELQGWCSPQLCVSVVAVQVLEQSSHLAGGSEKALLIEYILSLQERDGFWESYWWDGRIYGTAHAIIGLAGSEKREIPASLKKASAWLLAVQRKDGGWNNGHDGESSPFHTALALLGLLSYPKDHVAPIKRGIQWLIDRQEEDGGWASQAILRVPKPNDMHPWNSTRWEKGSTGVGILVRDQHRLFTTATVLGALGAYRRRYGETD